MESVAKCIIALIVMTLAYFSIVSASDTITMFQTGPFTGSIDLGYKCNDTEIYDSYRGAFISGLNYTEYVVKLCSCVIDLMVFDAPLVNFNNSSLLSVAVGANLLDHGVDTDTIRIYEHEINGYPGAVASGYVPKDDMTLYWADFYVSSNTVGHVSVWDNETKMVSAMRTIKVTEAA